MRNAQQCAPTRCRCGSRLPKPTYVKGVWQMVCTCHTQYVWSFHPISNGCWKIRSDMPLFDSKEIVEVA